MIPYILFFIAVFLGFYGFFRYRLSNPSKAVLIMIAGFGVLILSRIDLYLNL